MPWYGSSSLIKSPSGFSVVICRSLRAGNQRHAQIIILREALLRIKEFGVKFIRCRVYKKKWRKPFQPSTTVNWEIYPVFADIISLSSTL